MARNRVIGRHNRMPWHLPADLRHFKALTIGKPIVMGRKTWESLPGLLPDRPHIVVTHNPSYYAEGCTLVHSIDEAIAAAGEVEEIMVVGGGAFYAEILPRVGRIYLTLVDAEFEGDTLFPDLDMAEWLECSRERHPADEKHTYPYSLHRPRAEMITVG